MSTVPPFFVFLFFFLVENYTSMGFPGGASHKEPTWVKNPGDIRDVGLIPGSGKSPGGRHGNPRQYFYLENPHGQRSLAGYGP